MDDPALMGEVDGPRQGLDQAGRVAGVLERPGQPTIQSAAGGVLEDQIAHPLVFADLEDLDDVGVLEPGRGLGLGLEPAAAPESA